MQILRVMDKPKLWSNEWFLCWQPLLLLGVNSPFKGMREDVRRRLGIDLDRNILIDRLLRNSFRIKVGDNQYQETFYGKPVFAIVLRREWNWLWNLIHKWDMNFANNLIPRLNFGFDTLTAYPEPGSGGGNTTADATIIHDNGSGNGSSFDVLRNNSGTSADNTATTANCANLQSISNSTNEFRIMTRGGFTLDITSVNGMNINAVSFWFYTTTNVVTLGEDYLHVAGFEPASNNSFAAGDFDAVLRTSFGNISHANTTKNSYNEIVFNQDGKTYCANKNIVALSTQLGWDINNSFTGTWSATAQTRFTIAWADTTQTEPIIDPKLVITYTLPATFVPQINII